MALRDKLRKRSQPFLEPGENIEVVLLAQTGPTPYLAGLGGIVILVLLLTGSVKYQTLLLTDRAVVVLKNNIWGRPKEVVARVDRRTPMAPMEGKLWGKTTVGTVRLNIHRRFFKDFEELRTRAQQ